MLTGAPELEKRTALRQVLETSELERKLKAKATELGKPVDELRVLVKATFMLGYDRNHTAVITDPELVDKLAQFLQGCGVSDIVVGEGRNIYDQYCEHRDVPRVAEYFGYDSTYYQVVDLSADQVPHRYPRGMAQDTLSRSWRDAEFRIVFAKMRSHPVDFTHLTIGGIQGVGARLEQFLFLERSAHRDTALLMPLTEFPPDFALIDGYASAADGLVGIIACPRFPTPHRLYAGADALAVNMVATRHMGLANPRASVVLDAACHWFGDPTDAIEVVGRDEPVSEWRSPYANGWTSFLSLLANPVLPVRECPWRDVPPADGCGFLPSQEFPKKHRPPRAGAAEKASRNGLNAFDQKSSDHRCWDGRSHCIDPVGATRIRGHGVRSAILRWRIGFELRSRSLRFDAGPYVLLDRPGLDWAFQRLGLDLRSEIPLIRIEELYDVRFGDGGKVQIYADRHRTAEAMEKSWPGSAKRYLGFVEELERVHRSVHPLQYVATPGWRSLVRTGAADTLRFLCVGCALRFAVQDSHLRSSTRSQSGRTLPAISRRGPESSRLGARPHSHRRRFLSSWRDRCHSLAAGARSRNAGRDISIRHQGRQTSIRSASRGRRRR